MSFSLESAPALPTWLEHELPFRRRTANVNGTHIHFIDEGSKDAQPLFLMHGNPTWCFLWRKVILQLVGRRFRIIAPDLAGFGLSEKPKNVEDHHLQRHIDDMVGLMDGLKLNKAIIVGQDWGGPISAGLAYQRAKHIHGMVFANTAVVTPKRPMRTKPFHRFARLPLLSDLAFKGALFPIPIMNSAQGNKRSIGWKEKAAYAWPLRNPIDRAGPLALARMVPHTESHPTTKIMDNVGRFIEEWKGPISLVWGTQDPILGRSLSRHQKKLPHAPVRTCKAGHFIQEEAPELLAEAIVEVADATPH